MNTCTKISIYSCFIGVVACIFSAFATAASAEQLHSDTGAASLPGGGLLGVEPETLPLPGLPNLSVPPDDVFVAAQLPSEWVIEKGAKAAPRVQQWMFELNSNITPRRLNRAEINCLPGALMDPGRMIFIDKVRIWSKATLLGDFRKFDMPNFIPEVQAQTYGYHVFFEPNASGKLDEVLYKLLCHELIHVRQFMINADADLTKAARNYFTGLVSAEGVYRDNPLEKVAYEFQDSQVVAESYAKYKQEP